MDSRTSLANDFERWGEDIHSDMNKKNIGIWLQARTKTVVLVMEIANCMQENVAHFCFRAGSRQYMRSKATVQPLEFMEDLRRLC